MAGVGSPYTPEQDAIILRDYPAGVPWAAIHAAVFALPGYHTDNPRAVENRAKALKVQRSIEFRKSLTRTQHAEGRCGKRGPAAKPAQLANPITVTLCQLVRHARALGLVEEATVDVVAVNRAARRADKAHRGYRVLPARYGA